MTNIIYSDGLVEITEDTLLFHNYYFPKGARKIPFHKIESVEILDPSLLSGKWRIHGTGDFRTWFSRDAKRPSRDMIFILHFNQGWWRTGFTVENSLRVRPIFEARGLVATPADREA